MAVTEKVKALWLMFFCLILLVLFVNLAGPTWEQLNNAVPLAFPQRLRWNLSVDAVWARRDRHLRTIKDLFSLPSEVRKLQQNWGESDRKQNDTCTDPVTNFVFIKVHKTASASTAVVFLRFAYKHHMIMCYPYPRGQPTFTLTFPRTTIDKSDCNRWKLLGDYFTFLVHHAVFNKTGMDRIMVPGTRYIGIMREPQSHFRSQFFYRHHQRRYKLRKHPNPLAAFLDDPERHERKKNITWSGERNNQAFIMGFPPYLLRTQDTELMDKVIRQLNQWYSFVIINEYYDESLVMLRRKFCWDMYDILHAVKKIHQQSQPKKFAPLNYTQLENHRRINAIDYRMYSFFNRTFWNSVREEEARGFWEEVAHFKGLLEIINTYCSTENTTSSLTIPASKWNEPFSVDDEFCEGLNLGPKPWARRLFHQMIKQDKIWKQSNITR